MSTESRYSIHTDVKFKPLELIDIRIRKKGDGKK
jgi:hypothetical protein